eukprot:Blabericola_migrator_1__13299@NODE_931_length_5994_cov_125_451324_g647_i0_p4_GENE_NODE_931_length_5994_cov_125_451324_g647_i0NODE_931_length_5994_cov_125_451324_g647_i0_p4_ORF_typecomplete_len187_score21_67_NODE_931_length_5994_cov_125_451324_g647_i043904950
MMLDVTDRQEYILVSTPKHFLGLSDQMQSLAIEGLRLVWAASVYNLHTHYELWSHFGLQGWVVVNGFLVLSACLSYRSLQPSKKVGQKVAEKEDQDAPSHVARLVNSGLDVLGFWLNRICPVAWVALASVCLAKWWAVSYPIKYPPAPFWKILLYPHLNPLTNFWFTTLTTPTVGEVAYWPNPPIW